MRWSLVLVAISLGGCNWICGKVADTVVERAAGVEIQRDGKKVTIKGPEGDITVTQTGDSKERGRMVVTDAKGKKMVMQGGDKKMKITTDDGVFEYGAAAQAPKDFPLPVIGGAKILMSSHNEGKGSEVYSLTLQTSKSTQEVAAYYADQLKAKGFDVQQNHVDTGQGSVASVNGRKDEVRVQVSAMHTDKQPGASVSLSWQRRTAK